MKAVCKQFKRHLAALLICSICLLGQLPPANKSQSLFSATVQKESSKPNDDSTLLETGNYSRLSTNIPTPDTIKLISYNIRYRSGEDLQRLIAFLRNDKEIGAADIVALQEVDRNKKRTRNVNTARLIAEELSLNYAWAARPPVAIKDKKKKQREEETGVAIYSPYPMSEVERIPLPYTGPGGRRAIAIGATIRIGEHLVRAYSVHADSRIPRERKMEQLQTVLDALARRPTSEPVVVMGDFNTLKSKDLNSSIALFTARGFTTPIPPNQSTWKLSIIKFRLDWIWLRGLYGIDHNVVGRIRLSDHLPLWATVKF